MWLLSLDLERLEPLELELVPEPEEDELGERLECFFRDLCDRPRDLSRDLDLDLDLELPDLDRSRFLVLE